MKTLPPGPPTLWLLDGSSYLYRAFYAVSRLTTSKGEPSNALFGFASMLRRIRREQSPELLAVCFDRRGKTERHEAFEAYKANRKPMPDDLAAQVEPIRELVATHRIPVLDFPGWEADDVMGTLAVKARAAGWRTVLATSDKDMLQLIDPDGWVLQWHTGKEEFWGRSEVIAEWGVPPERIVDVLSLMGDSSDNVPGVKGIGEKGAVELISTFGSLDAIWTRLDEVKKPALRKKLAEGRDAAEMSRSLVTIRTDLPIEFDPESFRVKPAEAAALLAFYRRWELRKLAEEMAAEPLAIPSEPAGPPEAPPMDLRWIDDPGDAEAAVSSAVAAGRPVVLHATGSGLEGWLGEPAAAALSATDGAAVVFPLRGPSGADFARRVAAALSAERARWIGDDTKRAIHLFARAGGELPPPSGDLSLASYVKNPGGRGHAFADVLLDRAGERALTEKEALGKEGWGGFSGESLGEGAVRLAGAPAARCAALLPPLEAELDDEGLGAVYRDLELPLAPVLARIERTGIRLDVPWLRELSREMEGEIARLTGAIHELAGESFNVASPAQLGKILFEKLGYTPTKKTAKTKSWSTGVDVLTALADEGKPIASLLLEHREISKLKGTYVDALPEIATPDGILHTSFRQTVAATGRLSSSDPNLQNIPVRTELGRKIRRAFVARAGMRLVSADYSQIELRLLAHLSGDPELIAAFRAKHDIHAATAAKVFGVHHDLVTSEMRRSAKTINFGILYGMGAFSLAKDLGTTTREAKEFIDAYFRQFPTVRSFLDRTLESARAEGLVRTVDGRVRRLPDLAASDRNVRANAERMAINAPLQGSAADLMKKAILRVDRALAEREPQARILLTVHDELLLEAPAGRAEAVASLAREEMAAVAKLAVPLDVDAGIGDDWVSAK